MAWTDPRTWLAGETVAAALLNVHLRDNFKAIGDPWTAYVPVWTSTGTAPALGDGTLTGAYIQVGKLVHYRIALTMGSTTTYGTGSYAFSLPVATTALISGGTVSCFDNSAAAIFPRHTYINTTTTVAPTSEGGVRISATSPFTFAVSDLVNIAGTYEAA